MERKATTRPQASRLATETGKLKQSTTLENDVRNRAYEIYLNRGPNHAGEVADWLQAEQELTAR